MNARTCTRLTSVILLAFVTGAPAAYAANATTTFNVTATVDPACRVSANNLNFGDYIGSAIDTQTNVTVNCIQGQGYTVALSNGNSPLNGNRQMKHGTSDFLRYNLYSDHPGGTVWNSLSPLPGVGTGLNQLIPVYGRLPGGQTDPAGSYSDTITVTVNYM